MTIMTFKDIVFVTIIPNKSSFKTGSLAEARPRQLLDRVRKQLARCGCSEPVFGKLDGTYEPERDEFQLHFHVLAAANDRCALERLKFLYPQTPTGSAAVVIQSVNEAEMASTASYCFKAFWVERVRYRSKNGKLSSKRQRLAPIQEREWLEWQARHPTESLLLLRGLRRHGTKLYDLSRAPRSQAQPNAPASRRPQ